MYLPREVGVKRKGAPPSLPQTPALYMNETFLLKFLCFYEVCSHCRVSCFLLLEQGIPTEISEIKQNLYEY